MKHLNLLFACIGLMSVMFTACDKDDFTSVKFDYTTEGSFQTQAFTQTGDHTFGELVLTSGLKKELEDNNTSLDLLDELKLKSLTVSHDGDSSATFNSIEKLDMYLNAAGLSEVFVAGKNPVPDGLNSVDMTVNSDQDLSAYLKAESFTFILKGSNTEPVPAKNLKIKAVWEVKASAK